MSCCIIGMTFFCASSPLVIAGMVDRVGIHAICHVEHPRRAVHHSTRTDSKQLTEYDSQTEDDMESENNGFDGHTEIIQGGRDLILYPPPRLLSHRR